MIRKLIKFTIYLLVILFLIIIYLSLYGIKTDRFNQVISNQIKKNNQKISVKLNDIKLHLDPFNFNIKLETKDPKIILENKEILLKKITTSYSIIAFFKKEFGLNKIYFETKKNKISEVIKFLRTNKDSPQLYLLDKSTKSGEIYIIAKINFDKNGIIKKDYFVEGRITNLDLSFLKKKINNGEFNFIYSSKNLVLNKLNLEFQNIKITSPELTFEEKNNFYLIKGIVKNPETKVSDEMAKVLLKNKLFENITLSSTNDLSFKLSKKYKISELKIETKINLKEATFNQENKIIKNFIPNYNNKINFSNHKININYADKININGEGDFFIEKAIDRINYDLVFFNDDSIKYNLETSINNIPINFNLINFKKEKKAPGNFKIKGSKNKNGITINGATLKIQNNLFEIYDLKFNTKNQISYFEKINLNFVNNKNRNNDLLIKKNNKDYILKGKNFNISKIIEEILIGKKNKNKKLFDQKNRTFKVEFNKNYIDDDYFIKDLNGNFMFKNNEIQELEFTSNFNTNKNVSLSIKSRNNSKVTAFYSDIAEPFVKKFKFIKGFEGGRVDFTSIKNNNETNSKIKIYDFKLKQLPALTKILTLASLQGIADILSGEGVRFDEFEMNFKNKKNLMEILEIYSIGPAISVLMEGYVQDDDIISLKGTLVPATTINKFVGSLPVLGEILVGKKTGEGVFGVSFKIKGPPNDLRTTVNPIKTLTPRFITRTLEKIKKTN